MIVLLIISLADILEIISAASDGVAALTSATKSAIVVSVSCPIAVIIGIFELYICLAKYSSLYPIKSSKDPPPLAIIIASDVFFLFIVIKRSIILDAQLFLGHYNYKYLYQYLVTVF